MAYWDDRWDLAVEGRVYPNAEAKVRAVEAASLKTLREKAATKHGDSPLVKPFAYKNLSE